MQAAGRGAQATMRSGAADLPGEVMATFVLPSEPTTVFLPKMKPAICAQGGDRCGQGASSSERGACSAQQQARGGR